MELEFSRLNPFQNLEFLAAKTPEELQAMIRQVKSELRILSIYFDGKNHVAWVQSSRQIRKIARSK